MEVRLLGICEPKKRCSSSGMREKWRFDMMDRLSCPECPTKLRDLFDLREHFRPSFYVDKGLCCPICLGMFSSKCALQAHHRSHNSTAPFVCAECGQLFCRPADRDLHLNVHRNEEQWVLSWMCHSCQKYHGSPKALLWHIMQQHCEKIYCCTKCKGFSTEVVCLRKHFDKKHKDEQLSRGKIVYRCRMPGCTVRVESEKDLQNHCNDHLNTAHYLHRCCYCGRLFESTKDVRKHQQMFHTFFKAEISLLQHCQADFTSNIPKPINLSGEQVEKVSDDVLNLQQTSLNSRMLCRCCGMVTSSPKHMLRHGQEQIRKGKCVCLLCNNAPMSNIDVLLTHLQEHADHETHSYDNPQRRDDNYITFAQFKKLHFVR